MAGTAPTDFHFTKMLDAGPVHCSVGLSRPRLAAQRRPNPVTVLQLVDCLERVGRLIVERDLFRSQRTPVWIALECLLTPLSLSDRQRIPGEPECLMFNEAHPVRTAAVVRVGQLEWAVFPVAERTDAIRSVPTF